MKQTGQILIAQLVFAFTLLTSSQVVPPQPCAISEVYDIYEWEDGFTAYFCETRAGEPTVSPRWVEIWNSRTNKFLLLESSPR